MGHVLACLGTYLHQPGHAVAPGQARLMCLWQQRGPVQRARGWCQELLHTRCTQVKHAGSCQVGTHSPHPLTWEGPHFGQVPRDPKGVRRGCCST